MAPMAEYLLIIPEDKYNYTIDRYIYIICIYNYIDIKRLYNTFITSITYSKATPHRPNSRLLEEGQQFVQVLFQRFEWELFVACGLLKNHLEK